MRHAKAEIAKPFAREAELEEKCKRLAELNAELNMDKRENELVDGAEKQSLRRNTSDLQNSMPS